MDNYKNRTTYDGKKEQEFMLVPLCTFELSGFDTVSGGGDRGQREIRMLIR